MTEEKLSSICLAISPVIYWWGRSSNRTEGDGVKKGGWGKEGGMGNNVIIARYRFRFIRNVKILCKIHLLINKLLNYNTIEDEILLKLRIKLKLLLKECNSVYASFNPTSPTPRFSQKLCLRG